MKIINGVACTGVLEKSDFDTVRCTDLFKQILLDDQFDIPMQKPEIESILNIIIEPKIIKWKVIETPTDKKIVIRGSIEIKVVYTALNPEQSVHSVQFSQIFYTFINCHENMDYDSICDVYEIKAYIEDIDAFLINERKINITTLVLITVKKCGKTHMCCENQNLDLEIGE